MTVIGWGRSNVYQSHVGNAEKFTGFSLKKVPTPHRNSGNNPSIFPAFDRISGQAAIDKNSSSCTFFATGLTGDAAMNYMIPL